MLLHISIPAKEPKKVASVLAELCGGVIKPFLPLANSFMVYANDEYASGFEVYPEDVVLQPGLGKDEPSRFVHERLSRQYSTTHCAIRTMRSKTQIEAIAAREQWRCIYARRQNLFNVYEFWLENRFLLELIVNEDFEEAKKYLVTNA